MKKIYLLPLLMLGISGASAQCPLADVTLTTQTQVDNFPVNYPGCSAPSKSITITGTDISNLTGLQNIVSLGGSLNIENTSLTSLNGLSGLTSITGDLSLRNNDGLSVLTGLSNLKSVGGQLVLFSTPVTSMAGLSNLESVGYLDVSYSLLANFNGLEKLTSMKYLGLVSNANLTSLQGLHNVAISPILDDYYIMFNSQLSDCAIKYLCQGTPDRPGTIGSEIGLNATGCSSKAQLMAACEEAALPVTLVEFDAKRSEGQSIWLQWTTSSETNSSYFQLERSFEGTQWQVIQKVTGQGESSKPQLYRFTDETASPDINFYRLKMVDLDGTFAYSRIINVKPLHQPARGIYPNPVSDKFQIGANDLVNLEQIEIYNLKGKLVHKTSLTEGPEVSIKQLQSGQYVVVLKKENGSTVNYKLVKQ